MKICGFELLSFETSSQVVWIQKPIFKAQIEKRQTMKNMNLSVTTVMRHTPTYMSVSYDVKKHKYRYRDRGYICTSPTAKCISC